MKYGLNNLLSELSKLGWFNILEKVMISMYQEFESVTNMFILQHGLIIVQQGEVTECVYLKESEEMGGHRS